MYIISETAGLLTPDDHDPDLFCSQPLPVPYFDGHALPVLFIEAKHPPYLHGADSALARFIKLSAADKVNDSLLVYDYYSAVLNNGYTKPLDIRETADIWKYVTPSEIFVHWNEEGDYNVCISCGCEWEEEHGLELVFKNGQTLVRAAGHGESYDE